MNVMRLREDPNDFVHGGYVTHERTEESSKGEIFQLFEFERNAKGVLLYVLISEETCERYHSLLTQDELAEEFTSCGRPNDEDLIDQSLKRINSVNPAIKRFDTVKNLSSNGNEGGKVPISKILPYVRQCSGRNAQKSSVARRLRRISAEVGEYVDKMGWGLGNYRD